MLGSFVVLMSLHKNISNSKWEWSNLNTRSQIRYLVSAGFGTIKKYIAIFPEGEHSLYFSKAVTIYRIQRNIMHSQVLPVDIVPNQ